MTGVFWIVFWSVMILYGLLMIVLSFTSQDVGGMGGAAGGVLVLSGLFWIGYQVISRKR
jgi:hypothetical protein